MMVIDSCGWIDVWAEGPHHHIYKPLLTDTSQIIVPSIVLCEVYKWMLRERDVPSAARVAARMRESIVVPLDAAMSLDAGALSLRFSLSIADSIVYACAVQQQAPLVTSDKIFEGLPGVIYHSKAGQPTARRS